MDRHFLIRIAIVLACTANAVVLAASWGSAQTSPPVAKTNPKINEPFKKPDLKGFIKKFESDDREVYARRHEIVAALDLSPGMAVADLGAGTGLFTRLIAEKVGKDGKVLAVDISPTFLAHVEAESARRGQRQVVTILGSQDSTNLPAESVDLIFVCDVYHHFERPENALSSIHRSLRPAGKLVVVDFDRVEGRSTRFILEHIRASKDVFRREIEAAGFRLDSSIKAPVLKENFVFRFDKASPSPRRSHGAREKTEDRREREQ